MIDQATIEEFNANLCGQLIQPSDEDYEEACKIYNAMIDRRPGLIARCADVADVNLIDVIAPEIWDHDPRAFHHVAMTLIALPVRAPYRIHAPSACHAVT